MDGKDVVTMTAHITIDGNLAADPEYGVSDAGKSWARLRVASHERLRGRDGNWVSGPAQYYQVAVFDTGADDAANTFHKGDPVSVTGRLTVEEFDRRDGSKGYALKVFARQVEPALRGGNRRGRVLTLDGATPIVVPNPDDPFAPPIYEGTAEAAHHALTAGGYQAATQDGEIVTLTVTDSAASATMSVDQAAPSAPSAPAGEPTVHHNSTGTAVTGVARGDVQVQAALKQEGFKWSAPRGFWFLPQGLDEQTRALRVAAVQATLAGSAITLPVVDHNPPTPSTPAPAVGDSKSGPAPTVAAEPARSL